MSTLSWAYFNRYTERLGIKFNSEEERRKAYEIADREIMRIVNSAIQKSIKEMEKEKENNNKNGKW